MPYSKKWIKKIENYTKKSSNKKNLHLAYEMRNIQKAQGNGKCSKAPTTMQSSVVGIV